MNNNEFFEALVLLAKEKGIKPETLIEKIQTAIPKANVSNSTLTLKKENSMWLSLKI